MPKPNLRCVCLLTCLAWIASYSTANAESPPAPATTAPATTAPATTAPATTAPATGSDDLSFNLLDDGPKESPEKAQAQAAAAQATERKAKIRRQMLTVHQAFGFTTLAALAATLVIGQLNYQDQYVNGQFSGRFERPHLGLGIGTTALFATTGALALFSPDPYEKKYRLDTAMVHRVSMALATAGMVTQMILGPITSFRVGYTNQSRLALGHLITGYATFAFMATGTIAYFF